MMECTVETFAPWRCGCGRNNPASGAHCILCGTGRGDSFEDRARHDPGGAFMMGYQALCDHYGASPAFVHIREIEACSPAEIAEILQEIERQIRDEG